MVVVLWIPGRKRVWLQESLTKRKPGPLVLGGSSPISYAQFGPKHPHNSRQSCWRTRVLAFAERLANCNGVVRRFFCPSAWRFRLAGFR